MIKLVFERVFVALTKEKLRDPRNFLSSVEEFCDLLLMSYKGIDLKNLLSYNLKGSQAKSEMHALSLVSASCYVCNN